MSAMTEWFSGMRPPVREGSYPVKCPLMCKTHYWSGKSWHPDRNSGTSIHGESFEWRGFMEEQKTK